MITRILFSATVGLILVNLLACAAPYPLLPKSNDPALRAFAESIAERSPVAFEIWYGVDFSRNLPSGTVGVCRFRGNRAWQIHIDPDWWENATELAREALMAHEMLHCETGMGHVRSIYKSDDKLMGKKITDSIRCLKLNGLDFCILEAMYMYEENLINVGFLPINKCNHKEH